MPWNAVSEGNRQTLKEENYWLTEPKTCSLAYSEIYIAIAYIFTHFNVENSGTTKDDLISVHDLGAPFPKRDSKGLQVTLQLR
jgi:hypothetical protein